MNPDVTAAYSRMADLYIERFGSADSVHPDDLAFLRRHLAGLPGRVLDAGCGPGHLTAWLAAGGCDVVGLDRVTAFLDHARATHPTCSFRYGSLAELDDEPGSLDGILAWGSVIHLPPADLGPALVGFRRVLRPGGVLVLALFDGTDLEPFEHKVTRAWFWSPAGTRQRLVAAGFTLVEMLHRAEEDGRRAQLTVAAQAG